MRNPFFQFISITLLLITNLYAIQAAAESVFDETLEIEIWERAKGNHESGILEKRNKLKKIRLDKLKQSEKSLFDIQYNKKNSYKGINLSQLLNDFSPLKENDLALLHFENGMIIPVKPNNHLNSNIFIALKIKNNKSKSKKSEWQDSFPPMSKIDTYRYFEDPNPTNFGSNKMVYPLPKNKRFFKNKKGKLVERFSPWRHVSSLTGIEFINSKSYDAQFGGHKSNGFKVFKKRCQYCHGVKMVGASFGWDFVEPLHISKKRGKKSLHYLVKYPKADSFSMGLKMPNQIDISPTETKDLWNWINKLEKLKISDYR